MRTIRLGGARVLGLIALLSGCSDDESAQGADASVVDAGALGARCVEDRDDGRTCIAACSTDETCYTQLSCSLRNDGARECTTDDDTTPGDDRCHRTCEESSDCEAPEQCIATLFFACSDFNGYPDGRKICMRPRTATEDR